MEASAQQAYCFGPFVLDPAEKVLLRDGRPISVPPKAIETLLVLVERHGHLMEKAEVLQRVWPDTFVEEATLAQNIFTLRKALGDSAHGHEYIETVPTRGYRFIAPVKMAQQPGILLPGGPAAGLPSARTQLLWIMLVVVVGVAGGLFAWREFHMHTATARGQVVLAVLPFENLSGDPGQEYFSDGLTEEMIAQLSRFNPERLRVIARTSAMQYKGAAKTAAQIGRELGVDYILESSVRREENRVRITTQLVRVSDQTHLWSQSYERDVRGVLVLQKEVAGDVATQIALKLNPRAAQRPAAILNLDAYEAYLKGRYFWNMRSEAGHLKAIEYFEQALAKDTNYAQAYSGLADAYALLGSNPTTALSRQEAMTKARTAALKALAIDEALADAHISLAFIYWHYDWNWPAAEKEFRRALELNPSYATAHHWYAYYLIAQGRTEQALEEIHRAHESDPLSLIISTDVAEMLYYTQRYDHAIQQAQRTLEMDPNFALARNILVLSYVQKHQYGEAIRELKKGTGVPGAEHYLQADLAITYALAGQRSAARKLLLQLEAESQRLHTEELWLAIAQVHAALGERDQTFAWLEKAFEARDGALTLIKVMPGLDSVRSDPRFADLVRRIGLPP